MKLACLDGLHVGRAVKSNVSDHGTSRCRLAPVEVKLRKAADGYWAQRAAAARCRARQGWQGILAPCPPGFTSHSAITDYDSTFSTYLSRILQIGYGAFCFIPSHTSDCASAHHGAPLALPRP